MTCVTLTLAIISLIGVTAQEAAAPVEAPTADQRIGGLEAYIKNTDPTGSTISGFAGPGHNAWLMTSAALVLFMTLPGLALFYGGLVRTKNVLSVLAQCLGITGLVIALWYTVGYSLVFGASFGSPYLGGVENFFMKDVDSAPNTNYCYWVSENLFAMFQLMFAIITPALIIGAIAERMKFSAILLFVTLWMFVVYFPVAHMTWGSTGLMNCVWNADAKIPAIDFAGGTVVHMTSGWSALVLCLMLGKRLGFGHTMMTPHSTVLCMVGTGMLYVGWFGFNAGSALASDGVAASAFTATTLAAGIACATWGAVEWLIKGKPSVVGMCTGLVAGLVIITPAAGFVTPTSSVIIGIIGAVGSYFACNKIKQLFGYDDSLDTFGVHAVCGTLGAIVAGIFADPMINSNLISEGYAAKNGLKALVEGGTLWKAQLSSIGITLLISVVGTVVITLIVKALVGLRPVAETEEKGLDIVEHGEHGYEH